MAHEVFSRMVTRRQFTVGTALSAAALAAIPSPTMFATAALGATDFSSRGYPELAVTITDSEFEGIPASLAAGRYLIKATSKVTPDSGVSGAIAFLSPTAGGMSATELINRFGPGASGGDLEDPVRSLPLYQMYWAGGLKPLTGGTDEAVLDLKAGEYIAWRDDFATVDKAVTVTVTGDFPQDVKEPAADITATLIDFEIQMEGNLTAGTHTIKVQHHGAQPHFLELDKGPDTMTKELIMAALAGEMSGTPVAGFSDSDLQPALQSPTQSIGTVTYHHVELTAGTYLATCFVPTAGTGVPHAMNGMFEVFKVTG